MPDHKYNDPALTPLQFLKAVYSDPTVPMFLRIRAADMASPYEATCDFQVREPWPGERTIVIRINGFGSQDNDGPGTNGGSPVGHA